MADYRTLSDIQLVRLLKEGDHAAFTEIYRRYWAKLYLYARKLLNDATAAEDIVQEIMLYIWTKKENLQTNISIAPYLYTAVRHKALTIIDRRKLQNKYLDSLSAFMDKGEYIADANLREKELAQMIDKAIAALPQKMKQIFELSKIERLSHKTIAAQLNISDKTIRNQLSTALKLIKLKIVG